MKQVQPPAVRPATQDDAAPLIAMAEKMYALHCAWDPVRFVVEGALATHYTRWLGELFTNPRAVVLVAESAGGLSGYLIGEVEDALPHFWMPAGGFIHDIWIEESARGQGVGEALAREAMRRLGALGASQVRLVTATANEAARGFFAGLGFRASLVELLAPLPRPEE